MSIAALFADHSLAPAARTAAMFELQSKSPDLGAGELAAILMKTADRRVAMKAAGHLSRIAGFSAEKTAASRRLLELPTLREAASMLVADWPVDLIDRAIALHHATPDDQGLAHVLFAIAMSFPDQLRPAIGGITLAETLAMLFSGAPDHEVIATAARYRDHRDREALERIGFAHTSTAVASLRGLESIVEPADRELWEASLANAGTFPDGTASRTARSFLGYVGHAGSSPHTVGGTGPGPIPKCVTCDQAAARILVLRASELPFGLSGRHDPAFYFFVCDCVHDNAVIRFTATGQEVPLGETCDGPSIEAFAGEHAMVLVPNPNERGYGDTTTAGRGQHQIGGAAPWIDLEPPPYCPGCHVRMLFLAAFDSGLTSFEKLPWKGKLFGFWCDACSVSWTRRQM